MYLEISTQLIVSFSSRNLKLINHLKACMALLFEFVVLFKVILPNHCLLVNSFHRLRYDTSQPREGQWVSSNVSYASRDVLVHKEVLI